MFPRKALPQAELKINRLAKSLAIVFLLLVSIVSLLGIPEVKTIGFAPHSPILVSDDTGFTSHNGVSGGNGSLSNPYIIEGWVITSPSASAVHIKNTRSHFIIRNVLIYPTTTTNESVGVEFENVLNGELRSVSISNETYGVWLANTSNSTVSSNIIWCDTNGIYVTSGRGNLVIDNAIRNCAQYGIWLSGTTQQRLMNNTVSHSHSGYVIAATSQSVLSGDRSLNNTFYGFRTLFSSNNTLGGNYVLGNQFGMIFEFSSSNIATGNNLTQNAYGMGLERENRLNTFEGNFVLKNQYGIYIFNSTENLVYNNFLDNGFNALDDSANNSWNTTRRLEPNILGGPLVGGNFYSDYTGSDGDNDGMGDTAYQIQGGSSEPAVDYLPLVKEQPAGFTDVAVARFEVEPRVGTVGQPIQITITVENRGTVNESFGGFVFLNGTTITSKSFLSLKPFTEITHMYSWNTSAYRSGYYVVVANISRVPGDNAVSDDSAGPIVVLLSPNVPGAPVRLTSTQVDHVLSLSWSPPPTDGGSTVIGYKVYRWATPGAPKLIAEVHNNLGYLDNSSLTVGSQYFYSISAFNLAGEGPSSSPQTVVVNSSTSTTSDGGPFALSWLLAALGVIITGVVAGTFLAFRRSSGMRNKAL